MVIPTLAMALAACAVDGPTSPQAQPEALRAQTLAVSGETLDALRHTVEDAQVRLLPAIGDTPAHDGLATALNGMSAALDANDAGALAASLGSARTVLDAEIHALDAGSPEAVELDALSLALTAVEDALPAGMRSL
ncbi:MAG TPA: hypothetical protein VFJ16_13185 [Longimicrobium sp.]|nr:hypothetical protein [Longimicrobium sp.]